MRVKPKEAVLGCVETRKKDREALGESPWGPEPEAAAHQECWVAWHDVNQQALEDVPAPLQMGSAHAPGFPPTLNGFLILGSLSGTRHDPPRSTFIPERRQRTLLAEPKTPPVCRFGSTIRAACSRHPSLARPWVCSACRSESCRPTDHSNGRPDC